MIGEEKERKIESTLNLTIESPQALAVFSVYNR